MERRASEIWNFKRRTRKEISLIVGFGDLIGRLSERGDGRQKTQGYQEREKDGANWRSPSITEEGEEEEESSISPQGNENADGPDLTPGERHESIMGMV